MKERRAGHRRDASDEAQDLAERTAREEERTGRRHWLEELAGSIEEATKTGSSSRVFRLLGESSGADAHKLRTQVPCLAPMQARFRQRMQTATEPREALLTQILSRSILFATHKTMYSFAESRFVIVDLKATREELKSWEGMSSRSAPTRNS